MTYAEFFEKNGIRPNDILNLQNIVETKIMNLPEDAFFFSVDGSLMQKKAGGIYDHNGKCVGCFGITGHRGFYAEMSPPI